MRVHCMYIVLLAAVTKLANADGVSVGTTKSSPALTSGQRIGRFLRSHEIMSEEEEERGVGATVVESVFNSVKSKSEQLESLIKGGQSTDDAFKLLALDNVADDLLANPQLQTWVEYMKVFNGKNPKQQTTLIKTLASHCGEDGVARIIEAAKAVPSTAKYAKRLETEQIQRWLAQEKTPDNILKALKLDQMRYDLFDKPELLTWVKYVDDWNRANPDQKTTLYSKLSKLLDDSILTDMLIKAKGMPSMEKIAVRVQGEQTQFWLQKGKSPDDLFTLLRLNRAGDSLLEHPIFDAWVKYSDDFRETYPKIGLNPIATITDHYSSAALATMIVEATKFPSTAQIARRLNSEQYRDWVMGGSTPAYVFSLLKLNKAGDKLFESPLLATWLKFADFYNQKHKRVSVTSLLRKRFGDETLARMLQDAMEIPATKNTASNMLESLVMRWPKNGVHPDNVYKWLRVKGRTETDRLRTFYEIYAAAYKKAMNS